MRTYSEPKLNKIVTDILACLFRFRLQIARAGSTASVISVTIMIAPCVYATGSVSCITLQLPLPDI